MAETEDKTGEVCALIRSGRVSLADVQRALRDAISAGTASLEWELDLDMLKIEGLTGKATAAAMTLSDLEHACDIAEVPWSILDPIQSPKQARAVLEALMISRADVTAEQARASFAHVTGDLLERSYELVEVKPADPS